eukprot:g2986.t1
MRRKKAADCWTFALREGAYIDEEFVHFLLQQAVCDMPSKTVMMPNGDMYNPFDAACDVFAKLQEKDLSKLDERLEKPAPRSRTPLLTKSLAVSVSALLISSQPELDLPSPMLHYDSHAAQVAFYSRPIVVALARLQAEKFCKWDDKSTGINPFRSIRTPRTNICARVLSTIVGCVLAAIRIPLLCVSMLLLVVFNAAFGVIPLGIVRRPLTRMTDFVFARLALLILGFLSIPASYANLRRLRVSAIRSGFHFGWGVAGGELLLCNFSSMVQILYLAHKFSPTFVEVVPGTGDAVIVSLLDALRRGSRWSSSNANDGKRQLPLNMILKSKNVDGPVVVFPEGRAKTNNSGVLRFEPVFGKSSSNLIRHIHLLAFKFPAQSFSPASEPASGAFGFAARMCMQLTPAKMQVTSLSSKHVPNLTGTSTKTTASMSGLSDARAASDEKLEVARELLSRMLGVKTLDLGAREYAAFVKFSATSGK